MTGPQLIAIREATGMARTAFACMIGKGYMTLYRWEQDGGKQSRGIDKPTSWGIVGIVNDAMDGKTGWTPLEAEDYEA